MQELTSLDNDFHFISDPYPSLSRSLNTDEDSSDPAQVQFSDAEFITQDEYALSKFPEVTDV